MFGKKKKPHAKQQPYNPQKQTPAIRASICTGEQVAGFKDPETGKFDELMLIRSPADLQTYLREYDVTESEIKREW